MDFLYNSVERRSLGRVCPHARKVPKKMLRGFEIMSRDSRAKTRRRISLLTTSSFVATTMLSGVGALAAVALTPMQAWAANECGDPALNGAAPDLFSCAPGTYPTGVTTTTDGDLTLLLVDKVATTTGGIQITDTGANFVHIARSVLFPGGGDPSIVNTGGAGLSITGGTGTINVDLSSASNTGGTGVYVYGNSSGVVLNNSGGGNSITLTTNDGAIVGYNATGVSTSAGSGATTLNLGATTVYGYGVGISATSTSGAINITNTGGVRGVNGDGVYVATASGAVTTSTAGVTSDNSNGIVIAGGSGAVSVTDTGTVNGGGASGIGVYVATSTGAIDINVHNVTTGATGVGVDAVSAGGAITINTSGDITSGTGIAATGSGASGVSITTAGGTITAANGAGISTSVSGSGTTVINSGSVIEATGNGITALASGAGTGGGAGVNDGISITTTADIGVAAAVGGNGINAQISNATNGDNININLGGQLYSAGTGIFAQTAGAGNITVITQPGMNITTLTGDGIDAFASGGNVLVHLLDGAITANTTGGGGVGPGIHASTTGAGTVTVITDDVVNNTGPGDGILTSTVDGANQVTVNAAVNNTLGAGVNASATGNGSVTVTLGQSPVNLTTANISTTVGDGIDAEQLALSGTQNATVNATAAFAVSVTNGNLSNGILASIDGDDGAATVDLSGGANGSVSVQGNSNLFGIWALASDGNADTYAGSAIVSTGSGLTVTVGTAAGTGGNNIGILAESGDGSDVGRVSSITLGAGNVITVGSAGSTDNVGVEVESTGNTTLAGVNATIAAGDNDAITVIGGGSFGAYGYVAGGTIFANAGDLNITFGNGGAIVVHDTALDTGVGILADDKAGGNVNVTLGSTSVTVDNGTGISAIGTLQGSVSVTTGGNVTAALDGIDATTDGTGNVSVTQNNGSVITVGAVGINATQTNALGSGTISVTSGGSIVSVGDGILATTAGSGSVSVSQTSTGAIVSSTADGIVATSGVGGLSVTANNVTATTGRAIVTNSGAAASITVLKTGTVSGLGDATHAVVDITTVATKTTTLTNNGVITSLHAAPASFADLAVTATTGSVVLNNTATGDLRGRVDFSGLTGTSTVAMTNAGKWYTTGTSTFGLNADSLTNSGKIYTRGTTTLVGLEAIANSGTIFFGSNTTLNGTTSNGVAADRIIANGTKLTGSGASMLAMDANLSSITQSSCASLTAADCLQIGSSAGVTAIQIKDTGAAAFGSLNSGIVIVTGSSAASTFVISPTSQYFNAGGTSAYGGAINVLDKPGLVFYQLGFSGGKEFLFSAPKQTVFQFAQVGAIAGDTWYTTTQSWFDRQADLRDTISAHATGSAPAVWMKIVGDWGRRDGSATYTTNGNTYAYDVSYRGDTAAVIAGVDLLNTTAKDSAWVVGVQGGYVDANERFRNSSTRLNLTGGVVGVYGTFVQGGLFVDGIINGNILTANWNLPSLGLLPAPWIANDHVNTWGGQLEAGYAFPVGATSFIEPLGSIAYGRTTSGALALPGASLTIDNADTLRGSLGGRIGTTASFQYYKVKVALEGRVWDEFDGKTNTLVNVNGIIANSNDISGVYGEIKGEANLFAVGNNLSAFVNTGVKWKTRYQDTTVSLGVRYQW